MLGRRTHTNTKSTLLAQYSATLGELTLRKHTELALLASKTQSDLANRAKTAFLGTMSHELRTPLNAIIGFSDLIRSIKMEEGALKKSVDYAEHISNAGRHLLEVVADILDISKIESGAFKLNKDVHSIADIIYDAAETIEERIRAKQQVFEVRLAPALPHLCVDYKRIKQILTNLLSNANKFTAERGRIFLIGQAVENGGVTIAIVDTGVGMAPEQIEIALRAFGQVQSHLTRTQEGIGLGLPLARALARQHGGELHLLSEPGNGTTAVLTLHADTSGPRPETKSLADYAP